MTHSKRLAIGCIMLLCMVIFAISVSVIIDLVVETFHVSPEFLFYGILGIGCVIAVSYAFGMIAEEVLERRARGE